MQIFIVIYSNSFKFCEKQKIGKKKKTYKEQLQDTKICVVWQYAYIHRVIAIFIMLERIIYNGDSKVYQTLILKQ